MGYIGAGPTRFNTADELTVTGDAQIDTTTLVVDSTNNRVGVGTASPTTALDVTGTVTADGILNNNKSEFFASEAALVSTGSTAKVYATNTTFDGVNGSLVLQSRPTSGADVYIATGSTPKTVAKFNDGGDISFYDSTGVTQGLFWDASTQRLGVGETSPDTTLHAKGSITVATIESTAANGDIQIKGSGTTGYTAIRANAETLALLTAGTNAITIDGSQNVGIGTTSPGGSLEVYKAGTSEVLIGTDNGGTAQLSLYEANDGTKEGLLKYDGTNNRIHLATSGAPNALVIPRDSGNVGIGTSAPSEILELNVSSGNLVQKFNGATATFGVRNQSDGSFGHFDYTNSRWLDLRSYSSDNYQVFTGGTARITIDSSGNVGIGTSSPGGNLTVAATGDANLDILADSDNNGTNQWPILNFRRNSTTGTPAARIYQKENDNALVFDNSGAERMRISSGGVVCVGATDINLHNSNTAGINLGGNGNVGQIIASCSGNRPLILHRSSSNGQIVEFGCQTSTVGGIDVTTSGTTYNTTSDRRLKTDIQPIADATDKLMQMQPVSHKWIAEPDGDAVHGFIAQDMQQICPEAVSGEDGGEEMMSMDYGRITPVLVAALQDAHRKIEELEQRIAEMEN